MDIRPIRTDDDHRAALREIELLWNSAEGTPENDKLDVLATLVEAYERKRWPIARASPREVLEHAIKDMGHTQVQLAEILGSRSRASEMLAGKRPITLAAARKISAAWNLPIALLIEPWPSAETAA